MEHIQNWVAAVGMEVDREDVCMVRGAQRKVSAAYLVEAVESLALVVSNPVEAARRLAAAAVAGQNHVLVARSPEVVAVVAVVADMGGLVVIDVAAEDPVDVFLWVSAEDQVDGLQRYFAEVPVVKMSAATVVGLVVVGFLVVDLVLEAAYAVVLAADVVFLVVKSIAEAYVGSLTKAAAASQRFVVA